MATSVGMAIAERWLASYFNRPGFDLFDYDICAGCLMEGISGEAGSLAAGWLGLGIADVSADRKGLATRDAGPNAERAR